MTRKVFAAALEYVLHRVWVFPDGYFHSPIDYFLRIRGLRRWDEPLIFEEDEDD